MTLPIDRIVTAGERLPHGSCVEIRGDRAWVSLDLHRADGVVRRTTTTDAIEEGEPATICTEGGLMAIKPDGNVAWVELRSGRIAA